MGCENGHLKVELQLGDSGAMVVVCCKCKAEWNFSQWWSIAEFRAMLQIPPDMELVRDIQNKSISFLPHQAEQAVQPAITRELEEQDEPWRPLLIEELQRGWRKDA